MDLALGSQQRVHRPVPAVRGLDRDRTTTPARLADLANQSLRVVGDAHPAQLIAGIVLPGDHRPVQVQVDPHEPPPNRDTVAHGGLPFLVVVSNRSFLRHPREREALTRYGITY